MHVDKMLSWEWVPPPASATSSSSVAATRLRRSLTRDITGQEVGPKESGSRSASGCKLTFRGLIWRGTMTVAVEEDVHRGWQRWPSKIVATERALHPSLCSPSLVIAAFLGAFLRPQHAAPRSGHEVRRRWCLHSRCSIMSCCFGSSTLNRLMCSPSSPPRSHTHAITFGFCFRVGPPRSQGYGTTCIVK